MSFIAKNPLKIPEIETTPPLPLPGMRGLFAKKDGWYEIDSNGVVKKLVPSGNTGDVTDIEELIEAIKAAESLYYYGDANTVPSDESLFSFTPDDETMTVSVKGQAGNIVFGDVVVPYKYTSNGKTYMVTTISSNAFNNKDSITSVVIPNSVKTIEANAFVYSDRITSVAIPESVTSIGAYAFLPCSALTDIYYKGSEEDWSKITLGSQAIPSHAKIHYNWIGTTQGYVDEKLAELAANNGATNSPYNGLDVTPTEIDLLSINILNDGTASIIYGDYPGLYSVDELVIPYEVEYEGQTYPVSTIGNSAFWEARINKLIIPDTIKMIEAGAFYQTGINEIIFCGDDITIQTSAFDGTNVSVLNLPKNVKFYNEKTGDNYVGAFSDSLNLKVLELPEGSIKKFDIIGNSPALERVNIPRSVKEIAGAAFYACTSLKEIEIPKEVESVKHSAFMESGIKTIYYEGTKNDWDSILVDDMGIDVFEGITILYDYNDGNGLTAEYVDEKFGDIDAALEEIITLQEDLMTPDGNEVAY